MLEGFEQPLPAQIKLGCLEQQQHQAEQEGDLKETRDTVQWSGGAQQGDTHAALVSGLLTVSHYLKPVWKDCPTYLVGRGG